MKQVVGVQCGRMTPLKITVILMGVSRCNFSKVKELDEVLASDSGKRLLWVKLLQRPGRPWLRSKCPLGAKMAAGESPEGPLSVVFQDGLRCVPKILDSGESLAEGQVSVVCQDGLIPVSPRQRDKVSIVCQDGSRCVPCSVPRWREVGVREGQSVHCVPSWLGQDVHCVPRWLMVYPLLGAKMARGWGERGTKCPLCAQLARTRCPLCAKMAHGVSPARCQDVARLG